jgi:hypothetical protein
MTIEHSVAFQPIEIQKFLDTMFKVKREFYEKHRRSFLTVPHCDRVKQRELYKRIVKFIEALAAMDSYARGLNMPFNGKDGYVYYKNGQPLSGFAELEGNAAEIQRSRHASRLQKLMRHVFNAAYALERYDNRVKFNSDFPLLKYLVEEFKASPVAIVNAMYYSAINRLMSRRQKFCHGDDWHVAQVAGWEFVASSRDIYTVLNVHFATYLNDSLEPVSSFIGELKTGENALLTIAHFKSNDSQLVHNSEMFYSNAIYGVSINRTLLPQSWVHTLKQQVAKRQLAS